MAKVRNALAAVGLLSLFALAAAMLFLGRDGFSARAEPSAFEAFVARRLRLASIPASARSEQNPVRATPEVLAEARAHYADHCAICHGADGRGRTEIGKNLYPRAPDMRTTDTQTLSDGELFFIIENGIRFTGMPAWGTGHQPAGEESWALVHFLRELPELSAEEAQEVAELMPKTAHELEEEAEAHDLRGEPPGGAGRHHEHQERPE